MALRCRSREVEYKPLSGALGVANAVVQAAGPMLEDDFSESDADDHPVWRVDDNIQKLLSLDTVVGIVISANAIVIGLETDLGQNIPVFIVCEHFFVIFFTLEMLYRLRQQGMSYFCDRSQIFDCSLVLSGLVSLYVLPFVAMGGGSSSIVSSLRLLRLLRVLRILRLFKMFHQLGIILNAFYSAFSTVIWVGILVIILDYGIAVFCTEVIGHNASAWGDREDEILNWFGTIPNSMRTLFIIMTLAEWDTIAFALQDVYGGPAVFISFILYIMIASYTMVSLVTGIISDRLIAAQQSDMANQLKHVEQEKESTATHITEFLSTIDSNKNGYISREEIHTALLAQSDLLNRLAVLGIDLDADGLSKLVSRLDRSHKVDGEDVDGVSISELVAGMMHMTGLAKASEVFDCKASIAKLDRSVLDLHAKMDVILRFCHESRGFGSSMSPGM